MKKLVAICLSILLVVTMLPMSVFAAENTHAEPNELLLLACSVFPEHADKLQKNTRNTKAAPRTGEGHDVVVNETRVINDREYLTYTEHVDGSILLTQVSSDSDFDYDVTTNSHSSGSGGSSTNITIKAMYVGEYCDDGYFKLSNVIYTTTQGLDVINSSGTASTTGYCSVVGSPTIVLNETTTSPAKIQYRLKFSISPGYFYTSTLLFKLQNNSATITHSY